MKRKVLRYIKRRPLITITLAAVLPGAIASLIEYFLTNGISGVIPILAAFVGGILAALGLSFVKPDEPPHRSETIQVPATPETSTPSTLPDSPPEERIFSPRTSAELVDEINGMTEVVAERVSARHIGQWLKVKGPIGDVSIRGREICVPIMETEPSMFLYFDESRWSNRLKSFDVGDQISVIGEIRSIRRSGIVRLEKCELVS